MLELFANPGFIAVAGALISAPIIIHLINRMRFKRIRWAAMEFLLKAQKRMRKRLIIEQLLLLALRCLLVALAGLLVCRFVGGAFDLGRGKPSLHIAVLDDSLSMRDQWKKDAATLDCFTMAKVDFLQDRVAKALSRGSPADQLVVIRTADAATQADFEPRYYDHLNDPAKFEELKKDIAEMQPTQVHAEVLPAIKKVQDIAANHPESRITLHILSDFRQKDWAMPRAEELYKALVGMGETYKDMKLMLYDAAEKPRQTGPGGYPPSHDNVGIVELRPSTRIVGKGMPVHFTMGIANYGGSEATVDVGIFDEGTGKERQEVDFTPSKPFKVAPGEVISVGFDMRFTPTIKANESYFAHVSARLRSINQAELPNDGLLEDNRRYAAVEVRERVPVLLIDGLGAKGREEGKDSFHVADSLFSVPSNRRDTGAYQIVYGDLIGGGMAVRALEKPDLQKYPTIFLMNVAELSPLQAANLENFVKEGGGVAFFMGPLVNPASYNKVLFKDGKGVFPVPLKEQYFPPAGQDALPEMFSESPRLLLREDRFPDLATYPIFGPAAFDLPMAKVLLGGLSVYRYFQVPRAAWRPEPDKAFELATLPNDDPVTRYQKDVYDITRGDLTQKEVLTQTDYARFRPALLAHFDKLERLAAPGSELKAYQLAPALDAMLKDQGKDDKKGDKINLTEFWTAADPKVQALRRMVVRLHDEAKYGDAFVIGGHFGKGRVVACMTTAGKDWNNWGGGSAPTPLYPLFVWELQNYLSGQGSESNLTVGTPVELTIDPEPVKAKRGGQLKMTRTHLTPQDDKPAKATPAGEDFGRAVGKRLSFRFDKTPEPGLYITELRFADEAPGKPAIATYSHVFNVDTPAEGPLQRISSDDLDRDLMRPLAGNPNPPIIVTGSSPLESDSSRKSDLSESPWFFLVLLAILVAEQALAVHLSFHLKGDQSDVLNQLTRPPAAAA
jgi:hypothetical protein